MIYNVFGSHDSEDRDIIISIPSPISLQECREMCDKYDDDVNLCVVEDGIMTWVYKGSVDEVNNSVYLTYHWHEQEYDCIVEFSNDRDICLKIARTLRTVLQYASRSEYRSMVKKALKGDVQTKINTMKAIDWETEFELNKKNLNWVEYRKAIAFSTGQLMGLSEDVELYTKWGVSGMYPPLEDYIYRTAQNNYGLSIVIRGLIEITESFNFEDIKE